MTSESGGSEERGWLLQPPEPGKVHFLFEAGEGTEITPELRAALDQLVLALGEAEVAGFSAATGTCGVCRPLGPCPDYGLHPCFIYFGCVGLVHPPCPTEFM